MNISRYRDLTILDNDSCKLVIACDSSGAIGPKELDVIKVDGYTVGRFLTRVVLMELLSVGATPLTIIDTLAIEMDPTGQEVINGIKDEAAMVGLVSPEFLNGSTEENIPVKQTGVGITAIGQVDHFFAESLEGDYVVVVGIPKVGDEVSIEDKEICNLPSIREIRKMSGVQEIVPVGSKGIGFELDELLKRNKLILGKFQTEIDLHKSAGPTTCVVLTCREECLEKIKNKITQPLTILGQLKKVEKI
ncbi:hypothetical protein DS745_15325 [Anaerobacillus alkaliphilus]|uniref:PurM-like N-terminal domain-containing protein n=1 Tax=Anaerobacillus alkaliphilus TaxID=1548597 RepID=A0A4V1LG93_9BACI|nr:AIR synthase related protein [Anaerobacillus alkaliphilus]RXI99578.1 hypothetical protein DS745_15325 [Anaerobacillus alkaliphilus]